MTKLYWVIRDKTTGEYLRRNALGYNSMFSAQPNKNTYRARNEYTAQKHLDELLDYFEAIKDPQWAQRLTLVTVPYPREAA